MIGKIFGALAGSQVAKHTSKVGGTGGALLGAAAMSVVRRMSIPAILVLGAGGYAVKRRMDKNAEKQPTTPPVDAGTAV